MKAKWLLQFALRCAPAMIVCVIKQPNALDCTSAEVLAEFLIKSIKFWCTKQFAYYVVENGDSLVDL